MGEDTLQKHKELSLLPLKSNEEITSFSFIPVDCISHRKELSFVILCFSVTPIKSYQVEFILWTRER